MGTPEKRTNPEPIDLEKELFQQFKIPKGTPFEEVPFQYIRHIILYGTWEEENQQNKKIET